MMGEIVKHQLRRKKIDTSKRGTLKQVYRMAKESDFKKFESSIELEDPTLKKAKAGIKNHKLEMKLVDVEFQGDRSKEARFITRQKKRVDFRELIKEYSKTFGIKIEMKLKLELDKEAQWSGELVAAKENFTCSTWLTEFPPYQHPQLDINNYL